MERTIYEITFADGTTDRTAAPACAPRHEVQKAYVRNNKDMVKAHGGIRKLSQVRNYNLRDFD